MDENTFLQTIENSYKETDDGEFSTLSVLLTPMDLLKSDERFARAKLYQIDSEEIGLDIVHDRFNENDNKTLEVYYDKTFIGYVRKQFDYEYVDNTVLVDKFCFNGDKLKDVHLFWHGVEFLIKGKSFQEIQRLQKEKESLLYDIYNLGDIFKPLETVSPEFQDDKEVVLAYVRVDRFGSELKYASERLRDDKEIVIAATRMKGSLLQYASERLKNDRDVILSAVTGNTDYALKYASKKYQNDKEIIWLASKKNTHGFEYASKDLLADKSFVLSTIEKGMWWVYECTSSELRGEKEVTLAAVRKNGSSLQYASDTLKNDKEIVLAAVKNSGYALQYAGDILKNNEEIVLMAISNEGDSLQYATKELQNNKDLIWKSIENCNTEYGSPYLAEIVRDDTEFVLHAIEQCKNGRDCIQHIFSLISSDILDSREFIIGAIKSGIDILPILKYFYDVELYVSKEYFGDEERYEQISNIKDKEIIRIAYRKFGSRILSEFTDEALLDDKEFILDLIKEDVLDETESRFILKYLSSRLDNDKDVVIAAVSQNGIELSYVNNEMKDNEEVVLAAINENGVSLIHASESIRCNKEVVLAALESKKGEYEPLLKFICVELQNDKKVVLSAMENDGTRSFKYASEQLQKDPEIKAMMDDV